MPCNDITEIIRVVLDEHDRLKHYAFTKRTCGQGVGVTSLLLDELAGKTADEILATEPVDFIALHPSDEELEEFLTLKHLIAVQEALEVLTGRESGGPADICAAAEIVYDEGECIIEAEIKVDLVADKIKACGGCTGCGVTKKVTPATTP
jgi:hypothetical protein